MELQAIGESARGQYRTRRTLQVDLLTKYANLVFRFALQVKLNRFSDFSPLFRPLFDDLSEHAELVEVLDTVLLGKNTSPTNQASRPTG